MKYYCTSCIADKIEDIPLVSHTPASWEIGKQPTCTEAGTKIQKCSECGEIVETAVWEAKGHTPSAWVTTKNATCTEAGKHEQTCQVCGTLLAEEDIPALGHFFGDWGVIDGQQVRVCECGEQEFGEKSGCTALLSVGAITVMLLAGAATILSSKKKR